ncbi:hypothetical protein ACU80P_22155 [Pandoraea sputorum]
MKIYGVLISSLLLSAIGSALAEPGSAVTYIDHAPYSGGAAAILPATGGSYVYSTSTRQDSRRPQRFILGKVPRQTFVFFTEQEEDALYRARADRRAAFEDERRKLAIKRSPPRRTAQLNWPKVTDDTGMVSGSQRAKGNGSDYVTRVQDVMETVAHGKTPDGYSQVDITLPPIAMNGLVVTVDSRYSDRDGDIYAYTVQNPGNTPASLREEEFNGPNVLAVSIFPKPVVSPGESTRVFVLARKREGK